MKLVAIDPGSNKCGYACFEDSKLTNLGTLLSDASSPLERRLQIAKQLEALVSTFDTVTSEEPLLLGRNNNGMQRLLGYLELITKGRITFFHPMTVKKAINSGTSDKLELALMAGNFLTTDSEKDLLATAIEAEAFDATDAVCVGLTYLGRAN